MATQTSESSRQTLPQDDISPTPPRNGYAVGGSSKGKFPANRHSVSLDDAWSSWNVLCFDGGGIRGIFSLMVLQRLMEYIRVEEKTQDAETASSFSPCQLPISVSHIPVSEDNTQPFTPFLPCHYFDFICGTSTGALITIMLSRLRMPVEDCLEEYMMLAGQVFGKPRHIHSKSLMGLANLTTRTKYDSKELEKAIKDVLRRRGEIAQDSSDMMLFQTQTGLCRSFVVSTREMIPGKSTFSPKVELTLPWIFRSYRLRNLWKDKVESPQPKNPDQGTNIAAWKVARAATAAPLYFSPLRIYLDDGDVMTKSPRGTLNPSKPAKVSTFHRRPFNHRANSRTPTLLGVDNGRIRGWVQFTDGAFGNVSQPNNPSKEALRELEFLMRPHQRIDTFVSIGTARRVTPTQAQRSTRQVAEVAIDAGQEVSGVHHDMMHDSDKQKFHYFRFNEDNGLADVGMDDWYPRASGTITVDKIRAAVDRWATVLVAEDLRKCAKLLVDKRRERLKDRSMWDRYAVGKYFHCNLPDCRKGIDETWNYQTSFLHHLMYDHDITDDEELRRLCETCDGGEWRYKTPRM